MVNMVATSSSAKSSSGGGGSSSSSSSVPAKNKKVKASVHNQEQHPPARCQVDGCQLDLSNAKAYYSRHKVCGNHSKSPTVTVKGIEQRFCQQCSRFHLLPEFDQGKRSCRRRLAGHNERRRKPPNGSLLSPRCSRLSSATVENRSQISGFLLDFSAPTKLPRKDPWPLATSAETVQVNRTAVSGELFTNPWHINSKTPSPDRLLQTSRGGIDFANHRIPPDNCYTGDSDSSCALSLLSYQPWGSRNQASPGQDVRTSAISEGGPVDQPTGSKVLSISKFSSSSWGSKGNEEDSSSSLLMCQPDMAMGQPFSQSTTPYVSSDLGIARLAYGPSSQQMHWPL